MKIGFVSLFPEMLDQTLRSSVLSRARERGLVEYEFSDPRDFVYDRHRTVDDKPYGGSAGMLIKAEPVVAAVRWLKQAEPCAVVFTDPIGARFDQDYATELATFQQVIFVCGRYEGIDDRARQTVATHTFSLGDFVLTGGEIPALAMSDAIVRLIPGVLGSPDSLTQDSHSGGLLSAPQFTRPEEALGIAVPEALMGGDHRAEAKWRRAEALKWTRENRPDLFCRARLEKGDLDLLS